MDGGHKKPLWHLVHIAGVLHGRLLVSFCDICRYFSEVLVVQLAF